MLFLVATPIGNLSDISFRAVDILKSADYILCEDTRHSQKLLSHYEIKTLLKPFHKFNEKKSEEKIVADLKRGISIALISDAGTPGISDPGEKLVKKCIEEGISVSTVPGPCAAIHALTISGLNSLRFQFLGFLPRKMGELRDIFLEAARYPGTSIFYESPKRIVKSLKCLVEIDKTLKIAVARELTKKFEEVIRGTVEEVTDSFAKREIKGEMVLLIEGSETNEWDQLCPEDHVNQLIKEYGLQKKEAIKMAAELRGVPKREIYSLIVDIESKN